ncbi:hypothetical protein [Tepidimonas sp.]|uniref:hypothetical protein n=1 Tax=Tepidimonas sp. TaxID=2002775 RepID=UPI002FE3B4C8
MANPAPSSGPPPRAPAPAAPLPGLLWLFAACNFVIGTGAFGMTGYLGPVADGLGVSVGAAGQTMTVYALANAVLAPLLMALTARWPRAWVMQGALGLLAGGSLGVAALLIGWLLHRRLRADMDAGGTSLRGIGTVLRQRDVVLALLLTLLYFTGIFVVTACMGPVQLALNPLTPGGLSALLAGIGAAGVMGTLGGGWAADQLGPRRTIALLLTCLLLTMIAVPWTAGHLAWTAIAFAVWTVCGFGLMTPQQSRLAEVAFTQAPLLLSLNASMVYIGTALGSAIGGAAIPVLGFERLAWLGAAFVAAALLTLAVNTVPPRPR